MQRSRAWRTFLEARAELRQLMETAESQTDQLALGRRLSDQENCLRQVVVALVGQFQAYIADLMDELCDNLPTTWEKLAPFQKRYLSVHVRRRTELVLGQHTEVDLAEDKMLERFKNAFTDCADWLQNPAKLGSTSNREAVYGFLKDNSSTSLDRAISQFRPDGLRFSDWLYKNYPAYRGIFDQLDNAIRLRNEAAHGQIAQRLTLRDARAYRVIIYRLVQKADQYLEVGDIPPGVAGALAPVAVGTDEVAGPANQAVAPIDVVAVAPPESDAGPPEGGISS